MYITHAIKYSVLTYFHVNALNEQVRIIRKNTHLNPKGNTLTNEQPVKNYRRSTHLRA